MTMIIEYIIKFRLIHTFQLRYKIIMIVFPILNFVLPLMLTSFIFVNSIECNECKNDVELIIIENYEVKNSQKNNIENNKNELNGKNSNIGKNSGYIY